MKGRKSIAASRLPSLSLAAAMLGLAAWSAAAAQGISPQNIPRADGRVASSYVPGPLYVLGVQSRVVSFSNRPHARPPEFLVTDFVNLPQCAIIVVPVLTGWELGYGSTNPANTSGTRDYGWNESNREHWFGRAQIDLSVGGLEIVPGGLRQMKIEVRGRVSDWNQDDPWWGIVRYQAIILGNIPSFGRCP